MHLSRFNLDGAATSSLTQIDLALEVMHTCSIQSKKAQKNSTKHLEEQKVEERNNSKSTQLKTGKFSCTGYTGSKAPVHPKATGCTGALAPVHPDSAAGVKCKKTQHHQLHRCHMN